MSTHLKIDITVAVVLLIARWVTRMRIAEIFEDYRGIVYRDVRKQKIEDANMILGVFVMLGGAYAVGSLFAWVWA